jgi:hypothetical protein
MGDTASFAEVGVDSRLMLHLQQIGRGRAYAHVNVPIQLQHGLAQPRRR